MEGTYKSVGQKLEEESNIYSPLGRNQVEHYNSRNENDTIDEIERYRKALDNSNNSRKSKRKMYLELIRKFENEERKRKRRSKSKSQKSIKSPFSMSKRGSRSRSKSNNIINIKAKGSILKESSRSGTFSKATFGG